MTPGIVFKYSRIYDKILRTNSLVKRPAQIISPEEIIGYIKDVRRMWRKDGKDILVEMEKLSNLKWEKKNIDCYIVGDSVPFSDPLTIPVFRNKPDYFIDILIHELIHILFDQPGNQNKIRKVWRYFYHKYQKEHEITKNHIPLHAIYSHILLKFYNKRRLRREIKLISYIPTYRKSWQIVLDEGYQKIVEEITDITKNKL